MSAGNDKMKLKVEEHILTEWQVLKDQKRDICRVLDGYNIADAEERYADSLESWREIAMRVQGENATLRRKLEELEQQK